MAFKTWGELNAKALQELKPDFGFRYWGTLSQEDILKIWIYLQGFFFEVREFKGFDARTEYSLGDNYEYRLQKSKRILYAVEQINDLYKANSYAKEYLISNTPKAALSDFYRIFMEESEAVVFELLSLYCKYMILENEPVSLTLRENESIDDLEKRKSTYVYQEFDEFAHRLNDIFSAFGIYVSLGRLGFFLRQDDKINEEIYTPVINFLSHEKWREVNTPLREAFEAYRQNTPTGFSTCVTLTVSAVQAYLQIICRGKTGSGEISKLIAEAQKKELIPNDVFSTELFKIIESMLMRERQTKGIAHPKQEYANEKNAKTLLNVTMIFLQHCIV